MKKVLFVLPLVALTFAVACKKQEAAMPAPAEQVATPAEANTAPVAAPAEATPAPAAAPAKPDTKKGK